MRSRLLFPWLALALLALILALQLKLWTGTGGAPEVWRLRTRVTTQAEENTGLKARNAAQAADVKDLKEGKEGVEERARSELGMIKPGEVFYQVVEPQAEGAESAETAESAPAPPPD